MNSFPYARSTNLMPMIHMNNFVNTPICLQQFSTKSYSTPIATTFISSYTKNPVWYCDSDGGTDQAEEAEEAEIGGDEMEDYSLKSIERRPTPIRDIDFAGGIVAV